MTIQTKGVVALVCVLLAGEASAEAGASPDGLRRALEKVDAKGWAAAVAEVKSAADQSIGASLDATGLHDAQRQVAMEWFDKTSQVARIVDNYAATKGQIIDHLKQARTQQIDKLAELAILREATQVSKVGNALAAEIPQREAQIQAYAKELVGQAAQADKRLLADTEAQVKTRVRQLLGPEQLPGIVDKIPKNILNYPEMQKAKLEEISAEARRTTEATKKVGAALGSAAAMGIAELQTLSANIAKVETSLANTPKLVMGDLEKSVKQTWDKAQKDVLSSFTNSLALPNLSQFNNLPGQLTQQIKGLIEPFKPEKVKQQLTDIFNQGPEFASGGMMIAAAAYTEMQASQRHRETMQELKKIYAKLEEMDHKLDQIIVMQQETNVRLGNIEVALRTLQQKQDAGFLAVMHELELIKSLLLGNSLNDYCACRDLFGDKDGKRFTKDNSADRFALDRLAGITPHPACLKQRSEGLDQSFQHCWNALLYSQGVPPILRRANWITTANAMDVAARADDVADQELVLAMYRDLGKAIDWLRLCDADKNTAQAALSMPPLTLRNAEEQADKLFVANPECIGKGKQTPTVGFLDYFNDKSDVWPQLVLWHAYAVGNMAMYQRAIHMDEPVKLQQAALNLEGAIHFLRVLGRPESLQSGSVLLKATGIAVDLRESERALHGGADCTADKAPAECGRFKQAEKFLTLALASADTKVAEHSPIYVGNLGAWLAWSKFREQGHSSKAEYILAARQAANGCRACLTSVIGPNWRVIHEDEDKDCGKLIDQQRIALRISGDAAKQASGANSDSKAAEAGEKGWCVSTAIVRSQAVQNYLKGKGDAEAALTAARAMLPLPLASSLYDDELQRSSTANLISDTVAWLYRERMELVALQDPDSPLGMVLRLEHKAAGMNRKGLDCTSEPPRVVSVPPAQLRATAGFRRLNLAQNLCGDN